MMTRTITIADARITATVRATLAIHRGQPLDDVLLSLAEVLANVIAVAGCDPDDALRCVDACTREWIACGVLAPPVFAVSPRGPQ